MAFRPFISSLTLHKLAKRSASAALIFILGCGGQEVDLGSPDPYARYLGLLDRVEGDPSEETARIILAKMADERENYLVREGAMIGLIKLGRVDLAPNAEPLLGHPEPLLRQAACRVLGHFRHAPSAAKLAERLRGDTSAHVRHEAARALGCLPASQTTMRPLAEGLQSKEPGTRLSCHEALVAASGLSHPADAHDAWKAWIDSLQP